MEIIRDIWSYVTIAGSLIYNFLLILPVIGGPIPTILWIVVAFIVFKVPLLRTVVGRAWSYVAPLFGRFMPRLQWPWQQSVSVQTKIEYRDRIKYRRSTVKFYLLSRACWFLFGVFSILAYENWDTVGPWLAEMTRNIPSAMQK